MRLTGSVLPAELFRLVLVFLSPIWGAFEFGKALKQVPDSVDLRNDATIFVCVFGRVGVYYCSS
jgi:hypothetical protein